MKPSEANLKIGHDFRELRELIKVNQVFMCKLLKMDQSAISRLESGGQQLTAAQFLFLRDYATLKQVSIISGNVFLDEI